MNIRTLQLFIEVAKVNSFAEAARKLDLDPSQASRTIANLEQHLNVQLFKRTTRQLTLTEAGQRYLARVSPLLNELEDAEEEARELNQTPSGTLRLTASTAFAQVVLIPHIKSFVETYPDIELDLMLTDLNLDLMGSHVDLACRLTPAFESDLVGVKMFDTHYHVVASPEYVNSHPAITSPEQLSDHKCVVFGMPQFRSRWQFRQGEQPISEVDILPRLEVSNALALRELLLQGLGPGLVADWLVREQLDDGSLVDLFPDWQATATDFETAAWLLYPSRKFLPLKTRVMIDYLKEKLGQA